jgi:hypothetical protein
MHPKRSQAAQKAHSNEAAMQTEIGLLRRCEERETQSVAEQSILTRAMQLKNILKVLSGDVFPDVVKDGPRFNVLLM